MKLSACQSFHSRSAERKWATTFKQRRNVRDDNKWDGTCCCGRVEHGVCHGAGCQTGRWQSCWEQQKTTAEGPHDRSFQLLVSCWVMRLSGARRLACLCLCLHVYTWLRATNRKQDTASVDFTLAISKSKCSFQKYTKNTEVFSHPWTTCSMKSASATGSTTSLCF